MNTNNRSLAITSLLFLVVSVLFSACSHTPITPKVTFATDFSNGETVRVQEKGTLYVELESPVNDQYHWRLMNDDLNHLKQIGEPSEKAYTDSYGSANTTMYQFQTTKVGSEKLTFQYKAKKGEEVKDTYSIEVSIRGDEEEVGNGSEYESDTDWTDMLLPFGNDSNNE